MKSVLNFLLVLAGLCVTAGRASASEHSSTPLAAERPPAIASPHAVAGGTLTLSGIQPKSFNGYLDNFRSTQEVFEMLYEPLLGTDPITLDFVPGLACRWSVSDDKRTFTFHLDPAARWSDGRPVSAADVR